MSRLPLKQVAGSGATDGQVVTWSTANDAWEPQTATASTDETLSCDAGVVVLDTVYIDTGGDADRADATSISTAPCIGFVVSKPTATTCVVRSVGTLGGFSGLTAGALVFLDTSVGGHTQTPPSASGNVVQIIGVAISATVIRIQTSLDHVVKA